MKKLLKFLPFIALTGLIMTSCGEEDCAICLETQNKLYIGSHEEELTNNTFTTTYAGIDTNGDDIKAIQFRLASEDLILEETGDLDYTNTPNSYGYAFFTLYYSGEDSVLREGTYYVAETGAAGTCDPNIMIGNGYDLDEYTLNISDVLIPITGYEVSGSLPYIQVSRDEDSTYTFIYNGIEEMTIDGLGGTAADTTEDLAIDLMFETKISADEL